MSTEARIGKRSQPFEQHRIVSIGAPETLNQADLCQAVLAGSQLVADPHGSNRSVDVKAITCFEYSGEPGGERREPRAGFLNLSGYPLACRIGPVTLDRSALMFLGEAVSPLPAPPPPPPELSAGQIALRGVRLLAEALGASVTLTPEGPAARLRVACGDQVRESDLFAPGPDVRA